MWFYVHVMKVVLCTHSADGVVYMLCCVHIVQVVQCACGVVYKLYMLCHAHEVACYVYCVVIVS